MYTISIYNETGEFVEKWDCKVWSEVADFLSDPEDGLLFAGWSAKITNIGH